MVYFIRQSGGGPIKIGTSVHPLLRLAQIQAHSPVKVELMGVLEGSTKLERELHTRFSSLRLHGEWFQSDPELESFICDVSSLDNVGVVPDYHADTRALFPYRPK